MADLSIYKSIPGSYVEFILASSTNPSNVAKSYKEADTNNCGYYLITYNPDKEIHDIWLAGNHIAGGYGFNNETDIENLTTLSEYKNEIIELLNKSDDEEVEEKEVSVRTKGKTIVVNNTTYTLCIDESKRLYFEKNTEPWIDIKNSRVKIAGESNYINYNDVKLISTKDTITIEKIIIPSYGITDNTVSDEDVENRRDIYTLSISSVDDEKLNKDNLRCSTTGEFIIDYSDYNINKETEGMLDISINFNGTSEQFKGIYYVHPLKVSTTVEGESRTITTLDLIPDSLEDNKVFTFFTTIKCNKGQIKLYVPDDWLFMCMTVSDSNLGVVMEDNIESENNYNIYTAYNKYNCTANYIITCKTKKK